MHKVLGLVLLVILAAGGLGIAQENGEVVLRVGSEEITLSEFEERYRFYLFNLASERGVALTEDVIPTLAELRPVFLDQLVTERVVLRLGGSLGLEVDPAFVDEQINAIRENVGGDVEFEASLSDAGLSGEALLRTLIAEAELSRQTITQLREGVDVPEYLLELVYQNNLGDFTQGGEICAKHILVETLEEAEVIEAELESGESFEDLAEARSQDSGSAVRGGDLGCFPRGATVPEFDALAASAPLNEVTEPIQTDFGYHLILPYERTEGGTLPLEEVAPQLQAELENDILRFAIEGYQEGAEVKVFEDMVMQEGVSE